jgi:hypothetical protein
MNKKGDAVTAFVCTIAFVGAIFTQAAVKGQLAKPNWNNSAESNPSPWINYTPNGR